MKGTLIIASLMFAVAALAADPMDTHYSFWQCQGTAMPYPAPKEAVVTPDSLKPVMVNHIGRHGARYQTSRKRVERVLDALHEADSMGTITPLGRKAAALMVQIIRVSNGRWGALDSLGMAEQRGIAMRMVKNYPMLFSNGDVRASSSKVPRCINSMYTFLYQVARLDNSVNISTTSGPAESTMLRPFDTDGAYLDWVEEGLWREPLESFVATEATLAPLMRVLGSKFPMDAESARDLVLDYFKVLTGISAMGVKINLSEYFSEEEANALWACGNLSQYLKRTATTLSLIPAEITSPLLSDIIRTTQAVVDGTSDVKVVLRFGHAETLLPLLSQMRLPGCYYMTNYFDTVGKHWRNFDVAPMAGNLQMVLFKGPKGRYYVRYDLNEVPLTVDEMTYIPWEKARERMLRCIPLYLRD